MVTIGIECESTEGNSYGVGRNVQKLLEQLRSRTDIRLKLYYKGRIPSTALYYFFILPIRVFFDRPDVMFFPKYMLPFGICTKTIVVLTNDLFYAMRSKQTPWDSRLAYRIFGMHAARHATMIMTHSNASKDDLVREGIAPERIIVNYLGI